MLEREDSDLIKGGALEDLRQTGEHCDVSLYTENGNVLEAHKVILSLHSSVFRRMLNTNSSMRPLLYMRGISTEIMTSIVNFIYTGSIDIERNNVDEFFEVGEDLNVNGLTGFTNKKNKKEDVNQNNLLPFSSVEQYRNLVAEKSNIRLEDINFTSADKDGDLPCTEFNTARDLEDDSILEEDKIQYESKTVKEMQESGETNNTLSFSNLTINNGTESEQYEDLILDDEEYDSHNESSRRKYDTHHDDEAALMRIGINDVEVTMLHVIKTMNQNFHRDKIEDVFQCNHCSRNEISKSRIKEHVTKHIDGITFHCLTCPKQISGFATFRRHMRKKHRHTVHTYL